jgi:hypothetical protein
MQPNGVEVRMVDLSFEKGVGHGGYELPLHGLSSTLHGGGFIFIFIF